MDFGAQPVFDGGGAPDRDATQQLLAWFERSSAERRSAIDSGLVESGGLLDRLREANGLVYNGEGEYEP